MRPKEFSRDPEQCTLCSPGLIIRASLKLTFPKENHKNKQNNISLPVLAKKLRVWLESLSLRFPHGVSGSAWVVQHCLQIVLLYCLHYRCKPHLHLHSPLLHHCCCLLAQGCQDLFHACHQTVSRYLDKTYIKLFYLQNRITITISTLIPVKHHKIQNASDTVNKLSTYNTPV